MDVTGKQRALQEKNIIKYEFNKQRILLAEDNPLNMEIAVELLSQTNAQVDTAANGKEVLDMFLNSEPKTYDVILMDVQMPQMDGYKMCIRDSYLSEKVTRIIYS